MKKQIKILFLLTYFLTNIATVPTADYRSNFQSFVEQNKVIDLAIRSKDFLPKLLKRNAVECAVAATFLSKFVYDKFFKNDNQKKPTKEQFYLIQFFYYLEYFQFSGQKTKNPNQISTIGQIVHSNLEGIRLIIKTDDGKEYLPVNIKDFPALKENMICDFDLEKVEKPQVGILIPYENVKIVNYLPVQRIKIEIPEICNVVAFKYKAMDTIYPVLIESIFNARYICTFPFKYDAVVYYQLNKSLTAQEITDLVKKHNLDLYLAY